jgi:hypothetical protein
MNSYELSTPRTALGLTAVAMAVITMGAMVILPAELESVSSEQDAVATEAAATSVPVEVAIGATCASVSETVKREGHVDVGCTTVAAHDLPDRRRPSHSRARTKTSRARSDLFQYSAVRD